VKLRLRKADLQKDADALFELDVKSFNRPFDCPAVSVEQLRDYLKDSVVYLGCHGRKVVASFSYRVEKDEAVELLQMVVLPEYQNKGVGKFLMESLLKLTAGQKIYTVTHPQNTAAIILYLKFGFQIYGWQDNYFGDGEPRLKLELNN
jgi:ribosomal-protein-alanine N-acetyltransferase